MACILVVEDNVINMKLIVFLLKSFGHEILTAEDGTEGLAIAQRERPQLILMDVDLPGMSGSEVVRIIKDDPSMNEIRVVAVTALAMVGDKESILQAGFDGYVSKPIEPESFRGIVEGFLARADQKR